ncbi:MAG: hypothetical protein V4850_27345 [Myxococcota bacterium]
MKTWLPYVVAAVLGIGVALLAFGPGMGGGGSSTEGPDGVAKVEKKVQTVDQLRYERSSAEVVADATANPPPPPGTLRPQNKAEIEHAAKLARPFNKHNNHVSAFWKRAAQLVSDPELAAECGAMSRYLRDQASLADDSIDIAGTVAKEQELSKKVRAAANGNADLVGIVDYIDASTQAVLDGVDPTTVPKPGQTAAQ